jgi:hypothetical protein
VMLYWYMDFFSIPNDLFNSHPVITDILGRNNIHDWQEAEERMVDRGTDGMRMQPGIQREDSIEAQTARGTGSSTFSSSTTTTSDEDEQFDTPEYWPRIHTRFTGNDEGGR